MNFWLCVWCCEGKKSKIKISFSSAGRVYSILKMNTEKKAKVENSWRSKETFFMSFLKWQFVNQLKQKKNSLLTSQISNTHVFHGQLSKPKLDIIFKCKFTQMLTKSKNNFVCPYLRHKVKVENGRISS